MSSGCSIAGDSGRWHEQAIGRGALALGATEAGTGSVGYTARRSRCAGLEDRTEERSLSTPGCDSRYRTAYGNGTRDVQDITGDGPTEWLNKTLFTNYHRFGSTARVLPDTQPPQRTCRCCCKKMCRLAPVHHTIERHRCVTILTDPVEGFNPVLNLGRFCQSQVAGRRR